MIPERIYNRIYIILLLALAPILFFSYYPIIPLGANTTMNFELSIPLIWLVLFDLLSLLLFIRYHAKLPHLKAIYPWLLFPAFLSVSVIWSLNPLRGLLTVGVLWLIYFAIFSFFALRKIIHFPKNFVRCFWLIFFVSSILVSLWCWLQSILDLTGLPQSATLMCDGCIYRMFGFPHPDGFAIEPQFMGNLLLAPTIFAAWFTFSRPLNTRPLHIRLVRLATLFFLIATLFLTFSRGAIYAFILAMLVLPIWRAVKTHTFRPLASWLVIILAFIFTLNAQALMSALGPTSETYSSAIAKSIHQLSLGKIDLRSSFTPDSSTSDQSSLQENSQNSTSEPLFEGYVAESTNTRLRLTDAALKIWSSDPSTIIFGVGLGAAGQSLYDHNLSPAPKEIVQNQYASLLLETGLLGCLLAGLTLYLALRYVNRSLLRLPLSALLIAYAVTICFFSGLPNALHIYLLPPLFLIVATLPTSKSPSKPAPLSRSKAKPSSKSLSSHPKPQKSSRVMV